MQIGGYTGRTPGSEAEGPESSPQCSVDRPRPPPPTHPRRRGPAWGGGARRQQCARAAPPSVASEARRVAAQCKLGKGDELGCLRRGGEGCLLLRLVGDGPWARRPAVVKRAWRQGECGSGSWPSFPASRPRGTPFPSSGCWSPGRRPLTAEGVGPPELRMGFRREGAASTFPRWPPTAARRVWCGFRLSGPTRWP